MRAWDRKDPAGDKHMITWDKKNLSRMLDYWWELGCMRDTIVRKGEAFLAGGVDTVWSNDKKDLIPKFDRWQMRLFANEPRILEKSKFIASFLEAHELVMNGIPSAYNAKDTIDIKKTQAHWIIVDDKVERYTKQLGGKTRDFDATSPGQQNNCMTLLRGL